MNGCSISTDAFNNRNQLPVPTLDILHDFLIAIHKRMRLPTDPKLDALFIHIINVLELDVVTFNDVAEEGKVFLDGVRVQGFGTAFFEATSPFNLDVKEQVR